MSDYAWKHELVKLTAAIKAAFSIQDLQKANDLVLERELILKKLTQSKSSMPPDELFFLQQICAQILLADESLAKEIQQQKEAVSSQIQGVVRGNRIVNHYNKNR